MSVRDQMADAAVLLLAEEGYQATSFSAVLEASGAPRGSIYHHFPEGKDQLISLAIGRQADRVIDGLVRLEGRDPAGIVEGFGRWWRAGLERSGFAVGCSLLAVTASAGAGELRAEAGVLFTRWIARLADLFVGAGVAPGAARSFAAELLSAVEGAVAIARAQQAFDTFDAVVARLREAAAALPVDGVTREDADD